MQTTVDYKEKLIEMDDLLDLFKPGNKIFLSSGPAIPARTVTEIVKSQKSNIVDLELIQLFNLGTHLSKNQGDGLKYRLKTFNIGESISRDVSEGKVDFIPSNLFEIPLILATGAVDIDIAIVQTSLPNKRGFLNLGIACDVADIAMKNAAVVVAEANPNVPVTAGETSIHIDQIDHIVESDYPLIERERKVYDSVLDRLGWHVSNLIEDGSTVVLHAGTLFDAIADHLRSKRNLGIFTNVISDWVIDLIEDGAISLERSRLSGGLVTTSYCYGTRQLYDYIDQNPIFEFYSLARIANPYTIRRIPKLISIMNVKKIDVSGESVIFHSGDNLISGYESKLNFAIGAAFSREGKAIVALRSQDQDGNSNIEISLDRNNELARSTLGATRYVVTEYGVANLFGKSIRERVLSMIDIAHPKHRERLLKTAKELGYAYPDQIYVSKNAVNYPLHLETVKTFKDGLEVKFRPIKMSDEEMMRRLFYNFSDEAKYLRYFVKIQVMPHKDMQKYVNIDYKNTLSIVGLLQRQKAEKIIAEGRFSYYKKESTYEMAFIVDERYQNKGIATFMVNYLIMIAKERKIKRLSATVLPENKKMLKVFQKASIEPKTEYADGIVEVKYEIK